MSSEKKLAGKVAIVTGSTYGIGFAIARRLAENGASVVVSSRKQSNVDAAVQKLTSEGHNVRGLVCHAGKREDRENLIDQTVKDLGGIDILVCNVAVNPHVGPIMKTTEQQWDKVLDTNLKATFLLCRDVVPHMEARQGGAILFVGSVAGFTPHPSVGTYSVSKTAMIGLVKTLAPELGKRKIRINMIAPGLITTTFSQKLFQVDYIKHFLEKGPNPLGRLGGPDDCVGAAAFLVSNDSQFITGETIVINGGNNFRL